MEIDNYIKKNKLKVVLKPNSNEDEIIKYDGVKNALIISVKAPAIENRANLALIKLIKKKTKKRARIIKGLKSREKILEIF
ncbi:DUF167 domain-containing protein [Candidatus Woesearchaeota archaeon]|nr:DUF167 domain-containing protein [Candidatus Woesearchaeota archaeon]